MQLYIKNKVIFFSDESYNLRFLEVICFSLRGTTFFFLLKQNLSCFDKLLFDNFNFSRNMLIEDFRGFIFETFYKNIGFGKEGS